VEHVNQRLKRDMQREQRTVKKGWCLRDSRNQEWWYVTEVLDREGRLIRAINERGLRWNAEPAIFGRVNDGGRGHDAKRRPARFAQAVLDHRGDWVVPRALRSSEQQERQELVLVGARHQSLVTEPPPAEDTEIRMPNASRERASRRDHPLIPTALAVPELLAYMAIVLC
jgi:hypothetical protein